MAEVLIPQGLQGPGVYVLEFHDGCYYVGRSNDRLTRIMVHIQKREETSAWCRAHGKIARVHLPIADYIADMDAWEQRETVTRMLQHGFERVRGTRLFDALMFLQNKT